MRAISLTVLTACGVLLISSTASAQRADPLPSRFEAGIGMWWLGRQALGSSQANETAGAGTKTPLFITSSDLASAAGIDGRIGVRLTRSLAAEAEASYLKPQLRIAISGDTEGAPALTATETIEQFTIGGGLVWYVPNHGWPGRFAPFVMAGGGYLRQLHEQHTLVETGSFFQAGGGATYLLSTRQHVHTKTSGVRVELRAARWSRGVTFDDGGRVAPVFGASAFVRF